MAPSQSIKLISRLNQSSKELKKSSQIKNLERYNTEADTSYQFVVDGKPGLPIGTKIVKRKNELMFELPDGRKFELLDWCTTNNSEIVDLNGSVVYDHASANWVDGVESISSNTCIWIAQNGSVNGVVGASEGFSFQTLAAGAMSALAVLASNSGANASNAVAGSDVSTTPLTVSGLTSSTNTGSASDQITRINKPSISGKGAAGSTITVTLQSGEVAQTTVDSDGNWTVNLQTALPEGANTYQVVTQLPGVQPSEPISGTLFVDSLAPSAGLSGNGTTISKASGDLQSAAFGGKNVETDASLSVSLKRINSDGSIVELFAGSVAVNPDGTWSVPNDVVAGLADGAYLMSVIATDPAGNVSETSKSVLIDKTAPSPLTAFLATDSDSGIKGDGITSDATPTISGSAATAGETITLVSPTGEIQRTTVLSDGTWTATFLQPLPEGGPQTILVTATDAAGNTSSPATVELVIRTVVITPPTVSIPEGPFINNDELNSDGGVAVLVTLPSDARVNDVITVSIPGGTAVTRTLMDSDVVDVTIPISLRIPTASLTAAGQGDIVVTTTYTDALGNAAANVISNLSIDSIGPAVTGGLTHTAANDTGPMNQDSFTTNMRPEISGVTEPNASVSVVIGTQTLVTTASPTGQWSVNVTEDLSSGQYTPVITATDVNGNTTVQNAVPFTIYSISSAATTITPSFESSANLDADPTGTNTFDLAFGSPVTLSTLAGNNAGENQWGLYAPPVASSFVYQGAVASFPSIYLDVIGSTSRTYTISFASSAAAQSNESELYSYFLGVSGLGVFGVTGPSPELGGAVNSITTSTDLTVVGYSDSFGTGEYSLLNGAETTIGSTGNVISTNSTAGTYIAQGYTFYSIADNVTNLTVQESMNFGIDPHGITVGLVKATREIALGTSSADVITATVAPVKFIGGGGNDTLTGGTSDDILIGDTGSNSAALDPALTASVLGGNDILIGGNGQDRLYGGGGDDTLTGGAGANRFVFSITGQDNPGDHDGSDVIVDFKAGDKIVLADLVDLNGGGLSLSDLVNSGTSQQAVSLAVSGADTVLNFSNGAVIRLNNYSTYSSFADFYAANIELTTASFNAGI
jgi:hypothetical protein